MRMTKNHKAILASVCNTIDNKGPQTWEQLVAASKYAPEVLPVFHELLNDLVKAEELTYAGDTYSYPMYGWAKINMRPRD